MQLSSLQSHVHNLNSVLKRHDTINRDHETWVSVRLCFVITSVTQAELYDDLYHNSLLSAPERVQYRSRCRECLCEVVATTAEFSPDDYYYLDPYLGVGASISCFISRSIDLGAGDKVCWNRAISLLTKEQPSRACSDLELTLVSSTQGVSSLTVETLDANLSVLHLARKYVGASVCLVPIGPKTLCGQLMEYRRTNSLRRFTEV